VEWLARSANPETGDPAQPYARHVLGVRALLERFVRPLSALLPPPFVTRLRGVLFPAAEFHDLGKLDDENQEVLRGGRKARNLPIVHSDAGVVELVGQGRIVGALLIASHHIGLPNLVREQNRGEDFLRVDESHGRTRRMKGPLGNLLDRHRESLGGDVRTPDACPPEGSVACLSVYCRMALSLLVDADHTDSSCPNRPLSDLPRVHAAPLMPERRLAALDAYVARFRSSSERSELRGAIYEACKGQVPDERIVACDSPVGSGKTTAVMAHLLAVAAKRGLRRVFVVLPFTNIIRQSAEVYRKALVLPGENPDDIVAEVHHLADFDDEASRDYAVRWNAPVVVTTAVAFFETLAAARPSALRRLHELAGSAVFVDEAHAALPAKFLPVAWRWMQAFADEWNVHWVLASGSLVRFWEMPEVLEPSDSGKKRRVPLLADGTVRGRAAGYERNRVLFKTVEEPLSVAGLLEHVAAKPGPRLVVLNTVQNAAVVAREFRKSGRFAEVFHLSTALTPADRETTFAAVKGRIEREPDGNWVLVGTSCIEAGMDLDFATGFREMASLASLLQCSGRVNRSGGRTGSEMVSFRFGEEEGINRNRGMQEAPQVLRKLLASDEPVSAELCTEALRRELRLDPTSESLLAKIAAAESLMDFPGVEEKFRIISADTRTVLVDEDVIRRIENFEPVDWREIQRKSVQIWAYRIDELRMPQLERHPGVYKWHLAYSPFLGYMEGILDDAEFRRNGGGVL
jgi:CRISPR-associated endonuclease/helicase Cas3